MTIDLAATAAFSVACPTCRAQPGERCRSAKEFHNARGARGLNRARVDEYKQHQRAQKAQAGVRQALAAGQRPIDADITIMLACTCEDCGLYDLLPLFAAAAEAVAR
ncbi:MAG: zinc finger domain-containing protein [Mycobacterium sp.]